jgi:fructuronate reductase
MKTKQLITPLEQNSLAEIANKGIVVPNYRLEGLPPKTGIVHIGPGAFFRAHQSWYTHMAMQLSGGDWGITCVSMRSTGVADALTSQNGLYCLAELDKTTKYEIIGSINEVLVAGKQYEQIIARLSDVNTKIVTLTITEKGYCLNSLGKLDMDNPDVLADIDSKGSQSRQNTAIGLLSHALINRWQAGKACLCIISCDNVTDNGHKLRTALIAFAQNVNNEYADWLNENLVCPCTMVDSITPATDDALREAVSDALNIQDNWPIKRESFVQWVIEDIVPDPKPSWEKVGVIFTNDVNGFEMAKLRLLNCPHSSLAYIGTLMGIETVFDAMQHDKLVGFVQDLIDHEILPSLAEHTPKELDAKSYSNDILDRFRNPSIRHLLSQIAWDGSQKLPMRILPIIKQNLSENRSVLRLSKSLAAWMLFVRLRHQQKQELVDPLHEKLLSIAALCNNDPKHDIALFLSIADVFTPDLSKNDEFIKSLHLAYSCLLPLLQNNNHEWFA